MVFSDWLAVCRRQPEWWREVAYAGTKLLYQPAPQPIVYIVAVTDILGRLALVPYGEHGTIPHGWRALARHYPLGECDHQDRPGSGSKLYYIISWPCSGLPTTPAILANRPAEKTRVCTKKHTLWSPLTF